MEQTAAHYRWQPEDPHWLCYRGAGPGALGEVFTTPPLADGSRALMCSGPWGVDGNHGPPGRGYVALVCLTYVNASAAAQVGAQVAPALAGISLHTQPLRWRGQIRGLAVSPQQAQLLPWMQFRHLPSGRCGNYICPDQGLTPLLSSGGWQDFDLQLSREQAWLSLGSCQSKQDLYHDCPLADLGPDDILLDFGLIWWGFAGQACAPPPDKSFDSHLLTFGCVWPLDRSQVPSGAILLRDFLIQGDAP